MDKIFYRQTRIAPARGITLLSTLAVSILFVCNTALAQPSRQHGKTDTQSTRSKDIADTSTVVVTEDYWKTSKKKAALHDSSGKQLSTQQMVDFLKNELKKLNDQINSIVQKAGPDSATSSSPNDVDVMRLFIIKGKLESMENMLDEWMKQREIEMNLLQEDSPEDAPKSSK